MQNLAQRVEGDGRHVVEYPPAGARASEYEREAAVEVIREELDQAAMLPKPLLEFLTGTPLRSLRLPG